MKVVGCLNPIQLRPCKNGIKSQLCMGTYSMLQNTLADHSPWDPYHPLLDRLTLMDEMGGKINNGMSPGQDSHTAIKRGGI